MIVGIGTDIVQLVRIKKLCQKNACAFATRILHPQEYSDYQTHKFPIPFLAKRFAAKEAFLKALGTGLAQGITWQDILVSHDIAGAPLLVISGQAKELMQAKQVTHAHLSISDEINHALAFVVLEK